MHIRVLIPSYNRNLDIVQALTSLVRQKYEDWSVVVVDNGSDLPLDEFLKSQHPILYNNPKIRIERFDETVPIIENWNRLLEFTEHCDFIKFLWSDDCLNEDYFIEAIKSKADIVSTGITYVDQENRKIGERSYKRFFASRFFNCFYKNYFGCPSSIMINTKKIGNLNFNTKNRYCADLQFMLDLMCIKGSEVSYIDRTDLVLVKVQRGTETDSLKFTGQMLTNKLQLAMKFFHYIWY